MRTPRRFTADAIKAASNLASHGVSFEAVGAFEFETAVVATDDRKDYGEVREVATGFIGQRIHVLVFTTRGDTCHVISLRKANRREIRAYVEKAS